MEAKIQHRRKSIVAGLLMPLAVFLAARSILNSGTPMSIVSANSTPPSMIKETAGSGKNRDSASLDPMLNDAQLERTESVRYEGSGRNIFRAVVENRSKAISPTPTPTPPDAEKVVQPQVPTIRLFGFASISHSQRKVFLSEGDDIFVGSEGEIVNRRYRITRIDSNSIDVEDLINHSVYTLSLPG